jgi:hypothetical protein
MARSPRLARCSRPFLRPALRLGLIPPVNTEQARRRARHKHPLDRRFDGDLATGPQLLRILIYPTRKLPEL